jgi:hypothetical protein
MPSATSTMFVQCACALCFRMSWGMASEEGAEERRGLTVTRQRAVRHLLEQEERPLVVGGLPHLQQRLPCLLGGDVAAALALHGLYLKINNETLLHDGVLEHLLRYASHNAGGSAGARTFWMVSSILRRLEWGSVQIQRASIRRTLFRPLIRFKHRPSSSFDSSAAGIQ